MGRITFIDSMRGFAAIWVVFFHLNSVGTFPPSAYQAAVKMGWLGVTIFFVISGFSVQMSASRNPDGQSFLFRRLLRVYPPYLAILALTLAAILLYRLITGQNSVAVLPKSLGSVAAILTLTSEIFKLPTMNWVYWTLSYELAFYLWLSLALFLPRLRWAVLLAPTLLALVWEEAPFFADNWAYFALGIAACIWREKPGVSALGYLMLNLATIALRGKPEQLVVSLIAMSLLLLATSQKGSFLNREPLLQRAGVWSYSLYLVHVPIGCWLFLLLDPSARPLSASDMRVHLAVDISAFTASALVAYAFYRLVEVPSMKMGRQHFQGIHNKLRLALSR